MMGVAEWVAVAVFVLGCVFARYTYLLDQRDKQQEDKFGAQGKRHDEELKAQKELHDEELKELTRRHEETSKLLFNLHTEDAKLLTNVQLDLAKNFHPKDEIKNLFDGFKMHVDSRFDRLERHMGMDRRGGSDV
jgi:3-methyladenine DNA glycosylase AlkD